MRDRQGLKKAKGSDFELVLTGYVIAKPRPKSPDPKNVALTTLARFPTMM